MKKFLVQFAVLIIVIGGAILFYRGSVPSVPFMSGQTKYSEITINEIKLKVEIADTQEKRSKGLGGRDSLAQDEGMLFIFEREDKYPFWMKGLKFPLDFVWIKGDKVVDIIQNAKQPAPGDTDESLPIYLPREPINKMLEVNAGTVERLKIEVGDTIKME